jgi:hypothetical protein
MGNELRQIAPDDPVALELAEVPRDEVEARQADNGAARPTTGRTEIEALNLCGWTRTNG